MVIQGKPKGQMNPFCLSLPFQLAHLITFDAGGIHSHSRKRNKCKLKWLKTPQNIGENYTLPLLGRHTV